MFAHNATYYYVQHKAAFLSGKPLEALLYVRKVDYYHRLGYEYDGAREMVIVHGRNVGYSLDYNRNRRQK